MSIKQTTIQKKIIHLIPTIGILLFFILYYYSSTIFPGGSKIDRAYIGFDWINNYWCDLMDVIALGGQPNPSRPFAITAIITLCISLAFFFYQFPLYVKVNKLWKRIIQICGIIAMFFTCLIFSPFHNQVILIASIFSLFALIGMIVGIAKNKMTKHIYVALFCGVLIVVNNYIYYSGHYLHTLPWIQKITFAVVLFWLIQLNIDTSKMKPVLKTEKLH